MVVDKQHPTAGTARQPPGQRRPHRYAAFYQAVCRV